MREATASAASSVETSSCHAAGIRRLPVPDLPLRADSGTLPFISRIPDVRATAGSRLATDPIADRQFPTDGPLPATKRVQPLDASPLVVALSGAL